MNTYKVIFEFKHSRNHVKTMAMIIVKSIEESDAKILAKQVIAEPFKSNIKSTQIQKL